MGMVARRSRGPTAASRKAVDVLQQYLRKCELELARRGVGYVFLTIFRAQMGTQNRYTRYTKIGLAWLVFQALAKVKYAKNIGKMAVCRKAAFPLRIARG